MSDDRTHRAPGPGPAVTATAVLNLTRVTAERQRYAIDQALSSMPLGGRLVVDVGDQWPGPDAIPMLAACAEERGIDLHIQGDPEVLGAWVRGARAALTADPHPWTTQPDQRRRHLRAVPPTVEGGR